MSNASANSGLHVDPMLVPKEGVEKVAEYANRSTPSTFPSPFPYLHKWRIDFGN